MAANSKWIEGVSPSQPVDEVARRVLECRLAAVARWLPLAAERSDEDVEYVHRLRVSTRRAVEGLRVFRKLVPAALRREMKKQLRRIRRAANDARDLDVLILRLAASKRNGATAAILDRLKAQRLQAQEPIVVVNRELAGDTFCSQIARLISSLRFGGKQNGRRVPEFGLQARKYFAPVADKFFKATVGGATAGGDYSDTGALHQLRICGKKLRYTMEILAGAFEPEFRSALYPRIEQLQDYLGKINDHATARVRFQHWLAASAAAGEQACFERLLVEEEELLAQSRREFLAWWTPERTADVKRCLAVYCPVQLSVISCQ